jgi:hypothetical protein
MVEIAVEKAIGSNLATPTILPSNLTPADAGGDHAAL